MEILNINELIGRKELRSIEYNWRVALNKKNYTVPQSVEEMVEAEPFRRPYLEDHGLFYFFNKNSKKAFSEILDIISLLSGRKLAISG